MMIEKISLKGVLPRVFEGAEKERQIAGSEIWLKDIVFSRGEFYLLEAESGTGKSSLCSFIYGNRRDYLGQILFDGINVAGFTPSEWSRYRRNSLAILPQDMRLFPELTVMENIEIKNRLTRHKSSKDIMDMLEKVELAGKADVKAARLSIGQQQRVATVRALCQPFDFLLLDEPVSHLDSRNNSILAELVASEASAQGAGVIATSVGNKIFLPHTKMIML